MSQKVHNGSVTSRGILSFSYFFTLSTMTPLLFISDPFLIIIGGGILVVPMDCSMIWAKRILMPSEVRLNNCEAIVTKRLQNTKMATRK